MMRANASACSRRAFRRFSEVTRSDGEGAHASTALDQSEHGRLALAAPSRPLSHARPPPAVRLCPAMLARRHGFVKGMIRRILSTRAASKPMSPSQLEETPASRQRLRFAHRRVPEMYSGLPLVEFLGS